MDDIVKNRVYSTRQLWRQSIHDVAMLEQKVEQSNVNTALDYHERIDDHDLVKEKMISRRATGITEVTSGDKTYQQYAPFTKQQAAAAVRAGLYESFTTGIGGKIINARMIFNNKLQTWEWTIGKEENEELTNTIANERKRGNFWLSISKADWIACAVESCPVFVSMAGDKLKYKPFSPAALYAMFHTQIIDGDKVRSTDQTDIEDASVVVLELSSDTNNTTSSGKQNYVAFFGRSDVHPMGRMVFYQASNWDGWPDVNDDSGEEWRPPNGDENDIANPLSWLNATSGEVYPEYPIFILLGGLSKTSDVLCPVNTSLYESCLEFDVGISALAKDALVNSKGTNKIHNDFGNPLPAAWEGNVELSKGQDIEKVTHSNSNAQAAFEIFKGTARSVAEGFSVPGSFVIEEPGGTPELPGTAARHMLPLLDDHEMRVNLNKAAIDRLWQIERGLYEIHTGKPLAGPDVEQVWNPGRFIMPQDETEMIANEKAKLDAGAISYVRYVRNINGLPTDKAAKEYIELIEKQNTETPPPVSAPQRGAAPITRPARGLQE